MAERSKDITPSNLEGNKPADMNEVVVPPRLHDPELQTFRGLHGNIGDFGGSFDPPHYGHIEAARQIIQQLNLDALVFIPAATNPLKPNGPRASNEHRLQMLKLMLADEPQLFVSPIELNRTGVSYTIDTLSQIRQELDGQGNVCLLFGADILPELHKWKDFEKLPGLATLVPVSRKGFATDWSLLSNTIPGVMATELQARQLTLDVEQISSTEIRNALAQGKTPNGVSPTVLKYIKEHNLYTEDKST